MSSVVRMEALEQLEAELPEEQTPADNLVQLIKQLIKEEQYEGVALLFTSETEAARNLQCIPEVALELLHDVCLQHLNDENHEKRPGLYSCAEELLKVLATTHTPLEELLLELLEMVEEQKSEYVFTSTLRALQVVLLRMGEQKPRALEWSLNSINTRLQELPLPDYLEAGYDGKQERLLEQNEQVQWLLMHYITVGLFYEPILKEVVQVQRKPLEIFRCCSVNRRNVLCCFLVQLLGKPLALLDLTVGERKTNAYTVQCARSLTEAITQCIGDPFHLLTLAELRVRWKRRLNVEKGILELSSNNIFFMEQKLPLVGLAIYFYMLLVEGVSAAAVPKVYAPSFVFEAGLYFAAELLAQNEPPLHYRALLLAKRLLEQLHHMSIPAVSLELEVHKNFCNSLCNIVGYSSQLLLRQEGVRLLRKYILQFDDEGKYLVLKNLLRTVGHIGISGYLAVLYKDLVADALRSSPKVSLPTSFSGQDFRTIFLQNICCLPHGAETDLMEQSDKVIASLNALRFFAIKDCHNRTGFWDFIEDIQRQFVEPLRKGLDISIAHYKAELQRVEKGLDAAEEAAEQSKLRMLDISIANAASEKNKVDLEIDRKRKIDILNQNLCTFDLMRSLLARATECVAGAGRSFKTATAAQAELYSHSSFRACSTYASTLLLQRQRARSQLHNRTVLSQHSTQLAWPAARTLHSGRCDFTTKSIDEFREREEQREQEEARRKASSEDAAKRAKLDAIRAQILEAALPHVPTMGWTRNTIVKGAEDAGFPSVVHGMFPEGGYALVSYFYGKCNEELVQRLQAETQNGDAAVNDPLAFLVRALRMRLEMIAPYKKQWPQALALIALPQNAQTSLAQVLTLVDDICYYAGDRSVDFGWYTRRVGLATIMKMTEIYMLQDSSANHANTWDFLKNRMEEAVQLQTMLSQSEGMTHSFQRSFNSAFVTARNILGLDYNRR